MEKPEIQHTLWQKFLHLLIASLVAPIYYSLKLTWRIRETGPQDVLQSFVKDGKPCIYAHWHGDELVLIGYYSFRKLAVLSSLSKDGSIMAQTLTFLGYKVFRGSSSRGGARGLLGLIGAVKDGSQSALAVDGPKGPIYEVKPGVVKLAMKTGMPIVPVRTRAATSWKIPRAWNKSYVPKPFTRVEVEYGTPIVASGTQSAEDVALSVKKALDVLTANQANAH